MSKKSKNQPGKNNSSAASLRERLEQELTEEFPREFLDQVAGRSQGSSQSPRLERGNSLKIAEKAPKESTAEEMRQQLLRQLKKETNLRLHEKQTVQAQIANVREEIQRLAETIDSAQNRVEKTIVAAKTIPEETDSQYHVNFLQFLLKFLQKLRQQVQQVAEGEIWLQAFQERHQKKNPFWNRVKKSGAKFFLAPDRTPSTQAA